MTDQPDAVALRPATIADWNLIHAWLQRVDIQRWWGSKAAAEAEIRMALDTPTAICSIITVAGVDAGYGHAVDAGFTGDAHVLGLPSGTWDVSLFIADQHLRGRGHGQAALHLITREVFETSLATAISVVVPLRNEKAVRVYERAGFRWHKVLTDPLFGHSWVMVLDRPV